MKVSDVYAGVRRWMPGSTTGDGVRLHEGPDRTDRIDRLPEQYGGRVGVDAVLDDLDRDASAVDVPATAADYGFAWDDADQEDREWWPQGITTSADAGDIDEIGGRKVVVVSWYAQQVGSTNRGARLTFVDVTDPG